MIERLSSLGAWSRALPLGLALALGCTSPEAPEPPAMVVIEPDHPAPIGPELAPIGEYHVGEIRSGDAFSSAVARLGVGGSEVEELVQALRGILDFRACRPGHWFEVERNPAGALSRFRYFADPTSTLLGFRDYEGSWKAMKEPVAVATAGARPWAHWMLPVSK